MTLHKKKILPLFCMAAFLGVSGQCVYAGSPIPFDGYTVTSGDITPTAGSCSPPPGAPPTVTVTCGALTDPETVVSDGMLQRRVTVSGYPDPTFNGTYIQFVITEPGVTGDASANPFTAARGNLLFTNEDFVKMHNRSAGISEKQTIIESNFVTPSLEDRFVNTTIYEFGPWASNSALNPWVHVDQQISQVDYSSDPLNPTLTFDTSAVIDSNKALQNNKPTDNFRYEFSQYVDMTDAAGFGDQGFKLIRAKGQYLSADTVTLPDGSTVSWNPLAGDEGRAMWIGQSLADGGTSPNFGYSKYTRVDSFGFPTSIDWLSFASVAAEGWNQLSASVFGAPPTLPSSPQIVAPTPAISAPDPIAPNPALTGTPPGGPPTPVSLPVSYYAWTVTNGVFTLDPCPVGVYCGPPIVNEGGLMQRIVSVGGVDYVQTIITDPNATGDPKNGDFTANSLAFKSENFVRIGTMGGGGGIGSGIAAVQHVAEQDLTYTGVTSTTLPTTGGQFAYNTELKTGWANGGSTDPRIAVDQRILVPDYIDTQNTTTDYTFSMKVGQTDTDKLIRFSDYVGTKAAGGTNDILDPIVFVSEFRSGAYQNNTHALTDPALLPSNGGNIAWNPGEAIQVTWVGGDYGSTTDPFGPSRINTVSYTNLSTGDRTSATVSAQPIDPAVTGPESWVDPFTQPPPTYTLTYTPPPF
ncbi:MAG TPA: hypothetical protein ENK48_02920 [Gammaproteobacteria bacterium]|nr:hypothetical protein [Gammaproteobacteria bacterium]